MPLSLALGGYNAEENNYANSSNLSSATQNTETKTNSTQLNRQFADNIYAAEAYYQQIIAQYGENYQEYLETVNVISLDKNETTQQQLRSIAEVGGGEYFLARQANEFNVAFERTKQKSEVEKYSTVELPGNQPQIPTSSAPNLNQITACTTIKMNRELGQIVGQVNRLSTLQAINLKYNNHVLARLKELCQL